ncbi:MAG: serine hydrolase domain-containing protein [Spirulinaceae cyanobacterium]
MIHPLPRALGLGLLIANLAGSCAVFSPQSQAESAGSDERVLAGDAREELAIAPGTAQSAIAFADFIAEAQGELEIPGVAVALVYQDQILLLEGLGYRDLEQELPVTPHTLFHIGSTHKSMTAMLAAIAVDRGLYTWDEPIITFAPEFELSDPEATATVTMRHLLSMRSGISDELDAVEELMPDDASTAQVSVSELFELVQKIELLDSPGEVFEYSNVAVSLAGYLTTLAAVGSGAPLKSAHEILLEDWILTPIGMNDAVLQWSDAQATGDVALPYIGESDRFVIAEREDFDGDILAPSGGLKASITDMAAYLITQVQGGIAPNGERVVSAENLAATWHPRRGDYAMGWEQETYQSVELLSHEGSFDNFLSVIGMIPEYEVGFVVLTNSSDAAADLIPEVGYELVDLLLELE